MIENIIGFYQKEMSPYHLIFSKIKFAWGLFLLSGILIFLGAFVISILKWHEVYDLVFVCFFLLMFLNVNSGAKKVLVKKYSIQPDGFIWSNVAFDELRINMLKNYLDSKHLLSDGKLKLLIELLYKKAQGTKQTGLIGAGVFLSFFVPIWSQFIAWLYKNPMTLNDALNIAVIYTSVLVSLFITLHMFQTMVVDIVDRKRETMKALAGMLEQILLLL